MMSEDRFSWEKEGFNKNPYRVPEDYFDTLADRILRRITRQPDRIPFQNKRIIKPWMVWVSGVAALLVVGWFGFRNFYLKPQQENLFQEQVALFVDFYAGELHEDQLANYIEENQIELTGDQPGVDYNNLISLEPVITEEAVYESLDH